MRSYDKDKVPITLLDFLHVIWAYTVIVVQFVFNIDTETA